MCEKWNTKTQINITVILSHSIKGLVQTKFADYSPGNMMFFEALSNKIEILNTENVMLTSTYKKT